MSGSLAPGLITLSATLNLSLPLGAGFAFRDFGLAVTIANGRAAFGLLSIGTIQISNSGAMRATLRADYNLASNSLSFSLNVGGADRSTTWNDAFGLPGLTITTLVAEFSWQVNKYSGEIGFAAQATLPSNFAAQIGLINNPSITLVVSAGTKAPCLAMSIGSNASNAPTVISMGNGAITGSYAQFSIAPDGCTVGSVSVPKGFSLNFTGAVFGVSTMISVNYKPVTKSQPYVVLEAHLSIGSFALGGFRFDKSTIDYYQSPVRISLDFAGGLNIYGGYSLSFSGGMNVSIGKVSAYFTARQTIAFSGFSFDMTFTACQNSSAVSNCGGGFGISGTAALVAANMGSATVSASLTTTGLTVTWATTFSPMGINLGKSSFTLSVTAQSQTVGFIGQTKLNPAITGYFSGFVSMNGNKLLFDASVSGQIALPGIPSNISVSAGATARNCTYVSGRGFDLNTQTALSVSLFGTANLPSPVGQQGFSISTSDVNFSWSQLASWAYDRMASLLASLYGKSAQEIAKALQDVGAQTSQITGVLVNTLHQSAEQVAAAFQSLGMSVADIGVQLQSVMGQTAAQATATLQSIGAGTQQIAYVLYASYQQSEKAIVSTLSSAGATVSQLANQISNISGKAASEISNWANNTGNAVNKAFTDLFNSLTGSNKPPYCAAFSDFGNSYQTFHDKIYAAQQGPGQADEGFVVGYMTWCWRWDPARIAWFLKNYWSASNAWIVNAIEDDGQYDCLPDPNLGYMYYPVPRGNPNCVGGPLYGHAIAAYALAQQGVSPREIVAALQDHDRPCQWFKRMMPLNTNLHYWIEGGKGADGYLGNACKAASPLDKPLVQGLAMSGMNAKGVMRAVLTAGIDTNIGNLALYEKQAGFPVGDVAAAVASTGSSGWKVTDIIWTFVNVLGLNEDGYRSYLVAAGYYKNASGNWTVKV
jgi:hypothetical protein